MRAPNFLTRSAFCEGKPAYHTLVSALSRGSFLLWERPLKAGEESRNAPMAHFWGSPSGPRLAPRRGARENSFDNWGTGF